MTNVPSKPPVSIGSQVPPRKRDGAAVGLAFGLTALAIGLISGELWLAAAVPAGLIAGSVSGPLIVAGGRIRLRGVIVAAVAAALVGDAAIALGMTLDHPQPMRSARTFWRALRRSGRSASSRPVGWRYRRLSRSHGSVPS